MSPAIATPPPGFIRHEVSGCIIPEGELASHEQAIASRKAHHSRQPVGTSHLQDTVTAKAAELREIEAKLDARLAAGRAALGEVPAATEEAPAAPAKRKR